MIFFFKIKNTNTKIKNTIKGKKKKTMKDEMNQKRKKKNHGCEAKRTEPTL